MELAVRPVLPLRPQWIAFATSLAVHLVVLSLLGGTIAAFVPEPVMVVTLRPEAPLVTVDRPRIEPQAPTPAPLPEPTPEAVKRPLAKAEPEPRTEVAKAVPDANDGAPRLKSRPGISPELARELASRRLRVSLFIEVSGDVSAVDVSRNELTPAAEALLAESLAKVRFEPVARAMELETRLCFDKDGVLFADAAECRTLAGAAALGK